MFEPATLGLFFGIALVAGSIDAIAGGGGLLTVPALLGIGLSPAQTLATNKGQSVFGSLVATVVFIRRGQVDFKAVRGAAIWSFVGSLAGAYAIHSMDAGFLRQVMPWLLLAIATYVGVSPKLGQVTARARLSAPLFAILVGTTLGFYDGFFGPGVGSLLVFAHVLLAGLDLVRASGHAKVLNFASNLASLVIFIPSGEVVWPLALTMALGQSIGARLGSALVLHGGARVVRPILIVASVAMTIRLLWQTPDHLLHRGIRACLTAWGVSDG